MTLLTYHTMNRILLIILLLLPVAVFSQNVVPEIIEQTGGMSGGAMNFNISGKMLKMAYESEENLMKKDKDLLAFLTKVKKMSVLINLNLNNDKRAKIKKILHPYSELMSVIENESKIAMYTLEEKGEIIEFVMCVEANNSLTVMNMTGIIDLEQLSKLSKGIDVNGTGYLKNLDKLKTGKTNLKKSK